MLANVLISLLILAILFYLTGVDNILRVLFSAKLELIVLAIGVYLILNLAMSYRIKFVLKSIGENVPLFGIVPSNLAGMFASDLTPARIGYFFTAFSLSSKHKIPLDKSVMSILGPQIFDFMIKVVSAGLIFLLITGKFNGGQSLALNFIVLLAVFLVILFSGFLVFYPPLLSRLSFFEKFPMVPRVFRFIRGMHQHSERILSIKWGIIAITFFTWSLKGLEWFLLSRAIGISLFDNVIFDFLSMMCFQAAITIIQFLPIPTLAGAGASEAAFVAVLFFFGVPVGTAVVFGLLTRLLMLTVDVLGLPTILDYLHKHTLDETFDMINKVGH